MRGSAERAEEGDSRRHCRRPTTDEMIARLITAVSQAGNDPEQWTVCLAEISAALGNAAVLLSLEPQLHDSSRRVRAVRIAADFVSAYEEKYHLQDPWRQRISAHQPGIGFGYELVPRWELLRTTFYGEWMAPQGLLPDLSIVGLLLKRGATPLATFAVFRHRDTRLLGLEDLNLLRTVFPHLQQAVRRTRPQYAR